MTDVWGDRRPSRRQIAVDVVGATFFGLFMVAIHVGQGTLPAVAALVLALGLAVRRVSWQLMSLLAFAGAVLQVIGPEIAHLANSAYSVFFFTLGSDGDHRVRRFGLMTAGTAVIGAAVYGGLTGLGSFGGVPGLATAIGLGALAAVVVFGGWVAGYLRWQNRQTVQARIDAQLEAVERRRLTQLYEVEQERRRIAADMHDVVAHSWAVVAAQSDGARYALQHSPAQAEKALEVIGETARTAMTDLRTIVAQLRDPGLPPSTPGHAQQNELLERMRASGMDLDFTELGTPDESPLAALTAHRILGESLTNALKHGDLSRPVRAKVDWTDGYRLDVTNHVSSAAPEGDQGGHGIVGMAERMHVAGGTFSATREGDRFVVKAHLPAYGKSAGDTRGDA